MDMTECPEGEPDGRLREYKNKDILFGYILRGGVEGMNWRGENFTWVEL